ncbi:MULTISPECIES: FtsB family cell division protein [Bacillus]|uniref:Cell division protein DivIC n=1 Tax=Bacillus paralicheniformis TaxID=1648923 RepID=A0ABY3G1S7_9BACI|nr:MULTISPECIES: septum formation initiator family protein [Bacillus]MEC0555929.1 septum formation initiator family protein [Bacillus haynesii]KAA0834555.1 septum formation initiator family protein [Bacillus paralicheniformis]KAA0835111.1 septum formation initiator family protein [Bacillus paralicheniformis]MBG9882660.1 cell division protein DIVIC [Bacillus paralicheniformis]MBR8661904.1 septum formation initiator family protein [Bacillus paralicheniformis]
MNDPTRRNISQIQNEYKEQMERKQQQLKRKRRGLYRRLMVFGAVVLLSAIVIVSSLWSQTSDISAKQEKKEDLLKQLEQLEAKKSDLKDEIVKLKDEDYVAELARKDYYLSKDGEIIFKFEDKSK